MILSKRTYLLIHLALLLSLFSSPAFAQADLETDTVAKQEKTVDHLLNEMKQEIHQGTTFPDSILSPPTSAQQQLFDDSTMAMYQNALYAYYEYRVSGFKHRKEVFAWQLYSSKLIFWSVLLLVISGISFSGVQFYKSMRKTGSAGPTEPESITEFEASAKGIKVSSPVLGVIILVISLAFFYLYLVYVYPISEIF
jgi:hypothetical protein